MKRVGINFDRKGKPDFFLVDKKKAEGENIIHLTVFNMVLVGDKRKVLLLRVSKECDFKNFWSFPAGHIESMEEAENPVLAAVRETEEETDLKLKKEELFIMEESGFKKAENYTIETKGIISEGLTTKECGLSFRPPHMVIPFVSVIKDIREIKLSNEFDRYEIVDMDKTNKYNLTPITKVMIEKFLKLDYPTRTLP